MVYVISQDSKPLMPCSNPIARLLLKQGKAKVKRREPFTIKLIYETTDYTQDLTLGVDTGSGTIGAAVSKDNGDIVYMSEVVVRNDITDRMSTGYAILMDIDGNKIDFSTMPRGYKTPKLSNCKRITARSTVMTQVKVV